MCIWQRPKLCFAPSVAPAAHGSAVGAVCAWWVASRACFQPAAVYQLYQRSLVAFHRKPFDRKRLLHRTTGTTKYL